MAKFQTIKDPQPEEPKIQDPELTIFQYPNYKTSNKAKKKKKKEWR